MNWLGKEKIQQPEDKFDSDRIERDKRDRPEPDFQERENPEETRSVEREKKRG
jgi:hypothetical protein